MKFAILLAISSMVTANSLTSCHYHGSNFYCVDSAGSEGLMTPAPASTTTPESYTNCHNHGSATYCEYADLEAQFVVEEDDDDKDDDHEHDRSSTFVASTTLATSATLSGEAHSEITATSEGSVTGCHAHGSTYYCVDASYREGYISPAPSGTPSSFTGCHSHATAIYCLDDEGEEVQFIVDEEGQHNTLFSGLTTPQTDSSLNTSEGSSDASSSLSASSSQSESASSTNVGNVYKVHGVGAFVLLSLLV